MFGSVQKCAGLLLLNGKLEISTVQNTYH